MENQKKYKGVIALLIIIIVILSALCVLFATGTISFNTNKVNDNDVSENANDTNKVNDNDVSENANDTNNEENNSKEWVNYLKSKNVVVKTSVWDSEKNDCVFNSISISSEDINKIIDKLSTKKITKYYYGNFPPTGTICSDRFKLEYENNKISLEADGYIWINDDIFSNKIDLDVDNTTYADNYTEAGLRYVYKFDVNFADVFNNYK